MGLLPGSVERQNGSPLQLRRRSQKPNDVMKNDVSYDDHVHQEVRYLESKQ
jgi:hypothetical protein